MRCKVQKALARHCIGQSCNGDEMQRNAMQRQGYAAQRTAMALALYGDVMQGQRKPMLCEGNAKQCNAEAENCVVMLGDGDVMAAMRGDGKAMLGEVKRRQ